jgi:hypothetical protein
LRVASVADVRRGTQVAALFSTLIESATLAGVEPERYLWDVASPAEHFGGEVGGLTEIVPA